MSLIGSAVAAFSRRCDVHTLYRSSRTGSASARGSRKHGGGRWCSSRCCVHHQPRRHRAGKPVTERHDVRRGRVLSRARALAERFAGGMRCSMRTRCWGLSCPTGVGLVAAAWHLALGGQSAALTLAMRCPDATTSGGRRARRRRVMFDRDDHAVYVPLKLSVGAHCSLDTGHLDAAAAGVRLHGWLQGRRGMPQLSATRTAA